MFLQNCRSSKIDAAENFNDVQSNPEYRNVLSCLASAHLRRPAISYRMSVERKRADLVFRLQFLSYLGAIESCFLPGGLREQSSPLGRLLSWAVRVIPEKS